MVKIEISSRIFILAENTNDSLWSILETIHNFHIKSNIIDEKIKENSLEDFLETCLEEFPHNFRGSVLIIEDTLTGEPSCMLGDIDKKGIIPEAVESIFKKINDKNEEKFYLSASYLEVCCESIIDLLESDEKKVKFAGDSDFQLRIQNVRKQQIHSSDIIFDLITFGTRRRSFERSAHTVFNISLTEQRSARLQGVAKSHLNFLFLSGCVDQGGTIGDHLKKGCSHFPIGYIVDLIDETNWKNVKTDDRVLKEVLKHFLGGIRIVCTVSPDSEDCLNFLRFSNELPEVENELIEIQKVPVSGLPSQIDGSCQDEPDSTTNKEKTTGMLRKSTPSYVICRNNSLLETIEEEEEEMEEVSISSDMTSTSTQKEKDELKLQNGDNDDLHVIDEAYEQDMLKRFVACPDSDYYISYYQRKYEELHEFTSNEKRVYQESFNIQLTDASSRIEELEKMNKNLIKQLNDAVSDCISVTQNGVSNGRADIIAAKREMSLLRRELEKSERKRNDCEMKFELLQSNFRNRKRELVESLDDAYKELSGHKDLEKSISNEDTSSEEEEVRNDIFNKINSLKNDNNCLRNEIARYASLSQKIEEYLRIKKCLVKEATLFSKIAGLEIEVCSLQKINSKLAEDLNKKDLELKELSTTYSLYMEENILLKGENTKVSKHLEQIVEEKQKQNDVVADLKVLMSIDADTIRTLSDNLERKMTEIDNLESENVGLKENLKELNKLTSELKRNLKEKEGGTEALILKNSKLKDEICKLENKSKELSEVLIENENEIIRLLSENSSQQEKINSLTIRESFFSNVRKEMDKLSQKLNTSETKITKLSRLDDENVKLKDEISELQYKVKSLLENSKDKFVKIQELVSENSILKDQIFSNVKEIGHFTECLKEKNEKMKEYSHENEKLKEGIYSLKQNNLNISESLHERDVKIQYLTSDNCMLKEEISSLQNSNKSIASEAAIEIKAFISENSLLKENIHTLMSNLEEKDANINRITTKQEEEKQTMEKLLTEVGVLKKEISLLHQENGCLSKILNHKRRKCNVILHEETNKMFSDYETLEKENAALSDANNRQLNVDRTKLFLTFPNEEIKDRSQFTCSSLGMDIALEKHKANQLRRKIVQQRKMFNMAKTRQIQMRTEMEICKSQMKSLQEFRDSHAVQNHRIMQLQIEAEHADYVHRTRIDCLEAFINGLRSENMVLRTQLHRVNCKLKNIFLGIKMVRKSSNSNLKQVSVQTIPSSTENSISETKSSKPNSIITKEKNTVPHVQDVGSQCECSMFSSPERQDGIPKPESPSYSVVKIKSKQSLEITMKKNVNRTAISEKKVLKSLTKTPYRKYVPSLYTGHYFTEECNVLGAEGWARLSREFDLKQSKSST